MGLETDARGISLRTAVTEVTILDPDLLAQTLL